jgi:hypothetical protein
MNIKDVISRDIDIPTSMVDKALSLARQQVKKFIIKKRNGDDRVVVQPSKKLKTIQYWLIINVFEKMAIHTAAVAYRDGKSILDNAILHKGNRFFLKLDFKDFFPSIKYSDLILRVILWHNQEKPEWVLDESAQQLIRLSCFFHGDALAVGYPTSPIISNIVMLDFDIAVSKLISDREKFGDVIYTRYADDLIFSTNKQAVSHLLLNAVSTLISNTKSPNIQLNLSKTKIGSSTGGTASVTGLKMCSDGHITIHRNQKDHIRLLLSLYRKGQLKSDEYDSLLGHLAYVHYVDSAFYTKLQNKYFKEIAELRLQQA